MLCVYAAWSVGAADPGVCAIKRTVDGYAQFPTKDDRVRTETRVRIAQWLVDITYFQWHPRFQTHPPD
jgi:hypothetical protein